MNEPRKMNLTDKQITKLERLLTEKVALVDKYRFVWCGVDDTNEPESTKAFNEYLDILNEYAVIADALMTVGYWVRVDDDRRVIITPKKSNR